MIRVWICYPTVLWVLYEVCISSDRGGAPSWWTQYHLQLHHIHAQLLPWILEPTKSMDIISDVVVQGWWHMYRYTVPLFYECYMRYGPHLTGVDHPTDHIMASNYTPDMLSLLPWFLEPRAWTMDLISGVVVQGWWYMCGYAIPLFYECYMRAWTTPDVGGSPLRPYHDLQLHPRHAQTVILVLRTKMSLNCAPLQWCGGPRMMIHVWIYCPTGLWVLYET